MRRSTLSKKTCLRGESIPTVAIEIIYLNVASSPPSSTTTAELLLSLSSFFDHSSHCSVPVNSIVSSAMNQNQSTVAYPPPPTSTYPGAYISAPPPAGYPTMDEQSNQQNRVPVETKSRAVRPCVAVVSWTLASEEGFVLSPFLEYSLLELYLSSVREAAVWIYFVTRLLTALAELLLSLSSSLDHSSHFSVPVNSIVSSAMNQNQSTVAYPPPPPSTYPGAYSAPPPAGYPTMDEQSNQQNRVPVETKSRAVRPCVAVVSLTLASEERFVLSPFLEYSLLQLHVVIE
uniref:Uncharacterized protein n=1 Tax=Salix viminalis TaxID=40686 RepID=A0A6N2JZ52_SALVM